MRSKILDLELDLTLGNLDLDQNLEKFDLDLIQKTWKN